MYRNDLKGNKNYFEFVGGLASHTGVFRGRAPLKTPAWEAMGGSGYRTFELPEGKITENEVNLLKKSRGNRFWFKLARG